MKGSRFSFKSIAEQSKRGSEEGSGNESSKLPLKLWLLNFHKGNWLTKLCYILEMKYCAALTWIRKLPVYPYGNFSKT